jgi:hypothetical protein
MTTRTSKQDANAIKIDVDADAEGDRLGQFNDDRDPIVSYQKPTDDWMLAFKMSTGGTACASLSVSGVDAVTEAVTAARQYIHTHKTTAVAPEGS